MYDQLIKTQVSRKIHTQGSGGRRDSSNQSTHINYIQNIMGQLKLYLEFFRMYLNICLRQNLRHVHLLVPYS